MRCCATLCAFRQKLRRSDWCSDETHDMSNSTKRTLRARGGGTKSLFCHEWSFFSLLTPCGQTDNNASIRNQRTSTNPDRSDLDMTKMTNVWCFPRFVFSELPSRILRKQHWCLISEGHTERIACRRSARWVACPEPCSQVSKEQLLG